MAAPLTDLQRLGQEFDATDLAALTFEPHAGYGQDFGDPDMRMPFGYLSAPDYKPLFELDHFFDCPPERLAAYARLLAEAPFLLAELNAAIGYMMNARIDLETGCPKATAIRTISGGIDRARAAITKATSV